MYNIIDRLTHTTQYTMNTACTYIHTYIHTYIWDKYSVHSLDPHTCTLTTLGEPHPSGAEPTVDPVSPSGLTLIGEPVSLDVITRLCAKGKLLGGGA